MVEDFEDEFSFDLTAEDLVQLEDPSKWQNGIDRNEKSWRGLKMGNHAQNDGMQMDEYLRLKEENDKFKEELELLKRNQFVKDGEIAVIRRNLVQVFCA